LADDTDSAHSVVREKQKPAGAGFEQIPEGILLDSCFSSILVVCKYYKQFVGHVLQMHLNTVG
jgi:hypothetical protein